MKGANRLSVMLSSSVYQIIQYHICPKDADLLEFYHNHLNLLIILASLVGVCYLLSLFTILPQHANQQVRARQSQTQQNSGGEMGNQIPHCYQADT